VTAEHSLHNGNFCVYKAGEFDPYSDDPRLAVRKVAICPSSGALAAGGTAGQVSRLTEIQG